MSNEQLSPHQDFHNFVPIAYFSLDENNQIVEVNPFGTQLLETEKPVLVNKKFNTFITETYQNDFYNFCQRAYSSCAKEICELELVKATGDLLYVHMEGVVIRNVLFNNNRLLLSLIDISSHQQIERHLQASEEKFRLFVESTKAWIWVVSSEGNYTYCNPSVEYILGYKPQEMIGKNRLLFVYEKDRHHAQVFFQENINKKQGWKDHLLRWQHKDGGIRYLESDSVPIIGDNGLVQGYRVVGRDVTARILAEEQDRQHQNNLNQVARQTTLGEYATALAHEINQPLAAMSNYISGCILRLEAGNYEISQILDILRQVDQQIQRSGRIIHSLKDFVKKGILQQETIRLNELIKNTLSFLPYYIPKYSTVIQLQLIEKPIQVRVDVVQMELVFLNLLRNSIEAMLDKANQEIIIKSHLTNSDDVIVSLIDSGPGIADDFLDRIFEPCFTTKQNNMGMGLAISRTIIEAHWGRLYAMNNSSGGACFEFTLPLSQEQSAS